MNFPWPRQNVKTFPGIYNFLWHIYIYIFLKISFQRALGMKLHFWLNTVFIIYIYSKIYFALEEYIARWGYFRPQGAAARYTLYVQGPLLYLENISFSFREGQFFFGPKPAIVRKLGPAREMGNSKDLQSNSQHIVNINRIYFVHAISFTHCSNICSCWSNGKCAIKANKIDIKSAYSS